MHERERSNPVPAVGYEFRASGHDLMSTVRVSAFIICFTRTTVAQSGAGRVAKCSSPATLCGIFSVFQNLCERFVIIRTQI